MATGKRRKGRLTTSALRDSAAAGFALIVAVAVIQALGWLLGELGRGAAGVLGRMRKVDRATAINRPGHAGIGRPDWPGDDEVASALQDLRRRAA